MNRRDFLARCAAAAALALPAPVLAAQDFVTDIVRQLEAQGYRDIEVERTLLGRMRITAKGRRGDREIIVNPATGEILRDLRTGGSGGDDGLLDDDGEGTGQGTDDDEEDEDHEVEQEKDNSGSGGGGEGGGGGSGHD